jgi:hypothetical protein
VTTINWCERAEKLREIEFARLTGESVEETRFGEDMVRFTKVTAAELATAIQYAERMCAQSQGKRTRFAMSARARPH